MLVANWKMNGSKSLLLEWIEVIGSSLSGDEEQDLIFCPPACYLSIASDLINKRNLNIKLGAQDIDPNLETSLTGGINGSMLRDLGCKYVIIGHSENRANGESNSLVNKKIKSSIKNGLKIIFCIGETFSQRKKRLTHKILTNQITKGLIGIKKLNNVLFAYEPIWSIGTGVIPKNVDLEKNIIFIKNKLRNNFRLKNAKVLYGGSVNPKNITILKKINTIDGFLIGGASQDSKKFIDIVKKTVI